MKTFLFWKVEPCGNVYRWALDVFYNAGIQFDGIIGVSAGPPSCELPLPAAGTGDPLQQALQPDHHYMG